VNAATSFEQQHISPERCSGALLSGECLAQQDFSARLWQQALCGEACCSVASTKALPQQLADPNKQHAEGGNKSIVPASRTKFWLQRLTMYQS
jgi:hypothetical protein